MKILVLNCGSSSVKYQLFDMSDESVIAKGIVEEVGSDHATVQYKPFQGQSINKKLRIDDHKQALKWVIDTLMDSENGVVKNKDEIIGVGHRVVHGGEKFADSVIIDEKVIKQLADCVKFAPLHNPPNIEGISAAQDSLPNAVQTGVFDTAFHQQMPETSYLYAMPYEDYVKLGIRRYGFHGTSHKYVAEQAASFLKRPLEELKIITCHLGNGASVTAVKNARSFDTSMGFTPLEGLMMGTRSGDMDPYIPLYLMEAKNMTIKETSDYLNKKCGLKGITGGDSDMRVVENGWKSGDKMKKLAFEMFFYRVRKYIGAYAFAMNGADAIVFTGGIGEHSPEGREIALSGLEFFGITLDKEANKNNSLLIGDGKVKVLVIPTNEELAVARETVRLIGRQ